MILNCIRPLVSPSPASAAFHNRMLSLQALEKSVRWCCVWRNGDIDRGKQGPSVYLVQACATFAPSPGVRHSPSDMTPVWKSNNTAHVLRAGGIPERLQKTWYLRGTRPSELPDVPHVDSTVSSSGVDLAPIWGPACLRSES